MTKFGLAAFRIVIAIGLLYFALVTMMFIPPSAGWIMLVPLVAYAVFSIASTFAAFNGRGTRYAQIEAIATIAFIALLAVRYFSQYETTSVILTFLGWSSVVILNYLTFKGLTKSTG